MCYNTKTYPYISLFPDTADSKQIILLEKQNKTKQNKNKNKNK